MNVYVPRAGSFAEKALAYLRENGATATAPLAEAIEAEQAQISSYLDPAVRHGVIHKEKRKGLCYWSEGDGKPPTDTEQDEAPLPRRRTMPPLTDGVDLDKVLHQRTPAPQEWREAEFTCALWNDGRLVVAVGEGGLTLSAEHTNELRRYLAQMEVPA